MKITKENYNNSSISEYQMRKKMVKTKPGDNDQIIKSFRRSTLSNQECEQYDISTQSNEDNSELMVNITQTLSIVDWAEMGHKEVPEHISPSECSETQHKSSI